MIAAGLLDRRITIESPTVTRDGAMGPVETWGTFATVWAMRTDYQQNIYRADSEDMTVSRVKWTVRYLPNLLNTFRVKYGNEIYRIVGTAQQGRQEEIELVTERVE